ncbi:MAG: hypothetical protein QM449_07085, partial [Synergistota bacterium]|nr:hypothetical protein [Synergistota bacterium]
GFLQYIAPTLTFFLGVSVFREPLDMPKVVTFVCIWVALGLYSRGSPAASGRDQGALAAGSEPGAEMKDNSRDNFPYTTGRA